LARRTRTSSILGRCMWRWLGRWSTAIWAWSVVRCAAGAERQTLLHTLLVCIV
jgi:hypothetical protein